METSGTFSYLQANNTKVQQMSTHNTQPESHQTPTGTHRAVGYAPAPEEGHRAHPLKGILFCLLAVVLWGAMYPVADHLAHTVNMFHATLIRYGTVALILAAMLYKAEGAAAFRLEGHGVKLWLLGSAGFGGFGLTALTALSYTSSTNISLMMATMPAISAVIAGVATRTLPPRYTMAAIVIAFAGVSLVLTEGDYTHLISAHDSLGVGLALFAAVCWVLYTRGSSSYEHWSTLRFSALTTLLSVPSIAAATLIATAVGYIQPPSLQDVLGGWAELSYLIIFAGLLAVMWWNEGNKIIGPVNGTLFVNLEPVTTFVVVACITATLPSVPAIAGSLLVIAGLVMNNLYVRRELKKAEQQALEASNS